MSNNYKIFYVNGCSHTIGCDIEKDNSVRSPYDLENCWAGQIHNNYLSNAKYINSGQGGSDNFTISYNTIEHVNQLLASGISPSEILVIIGWSGPDRRSFISDWKPSKAIFRKFPDFPYHVQFSSQFSEIKNSTIPYYKELYNGLTRHSSMLEDMTNFLYVYNSTVNFLQSKKIPYFMFHSISVSWDEVLTKQGLRISAIGLKLDTNLLNDNRKKIKDMIFYKNYENDNFMLKNISMYAYLRKNKFSFSPTHHFRKDGHAEWANILSTKLKDLALI